MPRPDAVIVAADLGEAPDGDPFPANDVSSYVDSAIFQRGLDLFDTQFWPLVDQFMNDLVEHVKVIDSSMAKNNPGDIHLPAHSIKSSSRQIGALRLGDIAAELEKCVLPGREVDRNGLAPAVEEMRGAISMTHEALEEIRKTGT